MEESVVNNTAVEGTVETTKVVPYQTITVSASMTQAELQASAAQVVASPAEAVPAKRTKVAILGFVQHFKLAPFADPTFEIWGLNELYTMIPRWDRWFELHPRAAYENDRNRVSDHIQKLKAMTCPVYMHKHWDDIPGSVPYPMDAVCRAFPNPCPEARPYLTNSVTYMIMLSILEGFQEVHLYGVDMAHDSEYCVGPETRVLTADLHWVNADQVKLGDLLLAFDETPTPCGESGLRPERRKYRTSQVLDAKRLTRPCYRLHMGDGTILTCSAEHRWLTSGYNSHTYRWAETETLKSYESHLGGASRIAKLTEVWSEDRSWDAGYLAAAFDGEGHLSQLAHQGDTGNQTLLAFVQRDNEMRGQAEDCLHRLGFDWRCFQTQSGCGLYHLKGGRVDLLRFLGQVRPRRLLAHFNADMMGAAKVMDNVPVIRKESIGDQDVIGLHTATGTFIAEGFASHNSAQRPSCEWAVGIAQGRGIKVYLPAESDLLKTLFFYGFEQEAAIAFDRKLATRVTEMETQIGNLDKEIERLIEMRAQYRGAHQDTIHWRKNWKPITT